MKRSGFARKEYTPAPAAPLRPLEREPNYTTKPHTDGGRPKQPRIEIPHLMLMARRPQQICLLRVPGVCPGAMLRDDCCHAHMNGAEFNKGLGMKAHDFFGVRACSRCHAWLDSSYRATREARIAMARAGLDRQVIEWRARLMQPCPHADWAAMHKALAELRKRGYVA